MLFLKWIAMLVLLLLLAEQIYLIIQNPEDEGYFEGREKYPNDITTVREACIGRAIVIMGLICCDLYSIFL